MTTPNPWERLREAAEYFVDAALVYASEMTFRDFLAKWPKADSIDIIREAGLAKLRQALAALPANPPEQPSSDAERERAIDVLTDTLRYARATQAISETRFQAAWDAVALMRSAPAPQPVPAPSIGESLASAGTHYVNPRTMQPVSTKVPAPPASDWRTDLGVTGNIGTGTVLP